MNTHIVDPKAEKGETARNCILKYKMPEGFDDLVIRGDGEALTGAKEDPLLLRFMLRALPRPKW